MAAPGSVALNAAKQATAIREGAKDMKRALHTDTIRASESDGDTPIKLLRKEGVLQGLVCIPLYTKIAAPP
ncbi:hypothetical protein GCM10011324_13280 [Allosediminivita pacifica]|nr:hypothetical protein GCM10011324_13280 [Allosediminivita pacifica]